MTEKEIQKAFASSRNLFLTGAAGTGKSYLLDEYISSHRNVLVCAPTGIAALHLGGSTMHQLFHIPVPCYEPPSFAKGNKKAVPNSTLKVLASADTVIVDEISMCRADVFRYAVKVLRKAEKLKGSKIRLIVSGDFSQLPPVVKKGDEKLLKKFGFDPSGFVFTTQEWKSMNFQVLELTDIKRQSDKEFIENLNAVRKGEFLDPVYFDRFVIGDPLGFEDAVRICGTNAEADKLNSWYLMEELPGDMSAYKAIKEGRVPSGMVEEVLFLKPGARVIFTVNDVKYDRYRNGSIGTVVSTGPKSAVVETDGGPVEVHYHTWSVYQYSTSGGALSKKETGKASQIPLKLAKAVTIHKSQGQTFDKAVVNPDVFAPGQLYVALSRVRSPEGLVLTRPLSVQDLIIDPMVEAFYKNGYAWEVKTAARKKASVSSARNAPAKKKASARNAAKPAAKKKLAKSRTKSVSARKKSAARK